MDSLQLHDRGVQEGTLLMDILQILQILFCSYILLLQPLCLQKLVIQKQVLEVLLLVLHQGMITGYVGDDRLSGHLLQFLQLLL